MRQNYLSWIAGAIIPLIILFKYMQPTPQTSQKQAPKAKQHETETEFCDGTNEPKGQNYQPHCNVNLYTDAAPVSLDRESQLHAIDDLKEQETAAYNEEETHLKEIQAREINISQENSKPGHSRPQRPHPHWRFDKLLAALGDEISNKELSRIKLRFESSFGEGVLADILEPADLFRKLKERLYITPNNIVYLQEILTDLKRPELIEMTIDYCSKFGNVLHFVAMKSPRKDTDSMEDKSVISFKNVKLHKFLDKVYTRDDLRDLQSTVADILCVDVHCVLIAEVSPDESLLVTIMLPDLYIDILVRYLDKDLLQHRFAAIGIDKITVDGKVYEIPVIQEAERRLGWVDYVKSLVTKEQDTKHKHGQLLSLYHQLANKDRQLQGMEDTCNQLRCEIEKRGRRCAEDILLSMVSKYNMPAIFDDSPTANGNKLRRNGSKIHIWAKDDPQLLSK